MKTTDGRECPHDEQLRKGLCSTCDFWGLTHDTCWTCSADLDDGDFDKSAVYRGSDGNARCHDCHEAFERNAARERARADYEYACDQKLSEEKDERGR